MCKNEGHLGQQRLFPYTPGWCVLYVGLNDSSNLTNSLHSLNLVLTIRRDHITSHMGHRLEIWDHFHMFCPHPREVVLLHLQKMMQLQSHRRTYFGWVLLHFKLTLGDWNFLVVKSPKPPLLSGINGMNGVTRALSLRSQHSAPRSLRSRSTIKSLPKSPSAQKLKSISSRSDINQPSPLTNCQSVFPLCFS